MIIKEDTVMRKLIAKYEFEVTQNVEVSVISNKGVYEIYWNYKNSTIRHYMFGLNKKDVPNKLYLLQIIDRNLPLYLSRDH